MVASTRCNELRRGTITHVQYMNWAFKRQPMCRSTLQQVVKDDRGSSLRFPMSVEMSSISRSRINESHKLQFCTQRRPPQSKHCTIAVYCSRFSATWDARHHYSHFSKRLKWVCLNLYNCIITYHYYYSIALIWIVLRAILLQYHSNINVSTFIPPYYIYYFAVPVSIK